MGSCKDTTSEGTGFSSPPRSGDFPSTPHPHPGVGCPLSFLSTDKASKTWETDLSRPNCLVPCSEELWDKLPSADILRIGKVAHGEEAARACQFSRSSQGPRASQTVGAQKRVVF